jgi:hypothetical protein
MLNSFHVKSATFSAKPQGSTGLFSSLVVNKFLGEKSFLSGNYIAYFLIFLYFFFAYMQTYFCSCAICFFIFMSVWLHYSNFNLTIHVKLVKHYYLRNVYII